MWNCGKMCAFYGLLTVKYAIYWTQVSSQSTVVTQRLILKLDSVCTQMYCHAEKENL